ncbi:hypothetical protein [[Mycoplasma] testudinis]|uniref:hypothetical protein n=1 Tax=[Mycoplasma] testudinis TaxID=33924 RepID=UPI000487D323|nr:hypothetical protein [[Mycoplasma] testudinis]
MESKIISFNDENITLESVKNIYKTFGWEFIEELICDSSEYPCNKSIVFYKNENINKNENLKMLEKELDNLFKQYNNLIVPKNPFSLIVLFALMLLGAIPGLIYTCIIYPLEKKWNNIDMPIYVKKSDELDNRINEILKKASLIIKQINNNSQQNNI